MKLGDATVQDKNLHKNTTTKLKVFCITYLDGNVEFYRAGDEHLSFAPDVLKDHYGNCICVKEYVTISQLRARVDTVNKSLKHKISLDAAMDMVFYKEATTVSYLHNLRKVNTV